MRIELSRYCRIEGIKRIYRGNASRRVYVQGEGEKAGDISKTLGMEVGQA